MRIILKYNYPSLYKEIYERIKHFILTKKLQPHEKLPPKRRLANKLEVSINTVTSAYEQLITEGYIYSLERSGYYVEEIPQLLPDEKENFDWGKLIKESETEDNKYLFSLSHMETNISNFPFSEWKKCEQKAFQNHKQELSRVTKRQGLISVRKAIAKMVKDHRKISCMPEQIVLGVGSQSLIKQVLNILITNNYTYLGVEDPGYTRLYNLLKHQDIKFSPIKLDNKGLSVRELEKTNANIAFVTPSHQFPIGVIMPVSRRTELLNWAANDSQRYILEDDYDSEFKYKTGHIPPLINLDKNESVIYLGSFSKTLLPSFRISYMILPKHLVIPYRERYNYLIPENNTLSLLTLKYFIETGGYNRHIKRMTNHYENIRNKLISEIKFIFKSKVIVHDSLAGLHFALDFYTTKTYEQIEINADNENIELYTLRRFSLNKTSNINDLKTIIVGYATIEECDIKNIVKKLQKVLT